MLEDLHFEGSGCTVQTQIDLHWDGENEVLRCCRRGGLDGMKSSCERFEGGVRGS